MKRTLSIAVLAASVLTLAACGDDDNGDAGSPAGTEAAGSTEVGGGSDYCDLIRGFYDTSDSLDAAFSGGDPAAVEAALTELKPILEQLRDSAPDELKDDAAAQAGGILELITIFETYDYDVQTASTSPEFAELNTRMSSDEMMQAQDNLDAYESEVCGIETDS